jgi:DNA-binding XRE family transcriptional regulator
MKTHPTDQAHKATIVHLHHNGVAYAIPETVLQAYIEPRKLNRPDNVLPKDFFASYEQAYTKAGCLLQGLRARENLTQVQFAKKIGVSQSNLSSMENGRRPIGKDIAKRIAAAFDINYRYFLS